MAVVSYFVVNLNLGSGGLQFEVFLMFQFSIGEDIYQDYLAATSTIGTTNLNYYEIDEDSHKSNYPVDQFKC